MKTACYNILIKEMEVMSMKNKKMKSGGLLTLAFLMAAGNVMPALAGSWQQDAAGWRWKNDDGSYHAGSWQWLVRFQLRTDLVVNSWHGSLIVA